MAEGDYALARYHFKRLQEVPLSFTRGNQVRAARLLKMKVTTLNSKIKHYSININVLVGGFTAAEAAEAARNQA